MLIFIDEILETEGFALAGHFYYGVFDHLQLIVLVVILSMLLILMVVMLVLVLLILVVN